MVFVTFFVVGLLSMPGSAVAQAQGVDPDTTHQSAAERERSGADPLLDLPPLPNDKATLVGGTIAKLDAVRDNMSLRAFGGKNLDIGFDIRTKIYRDGVPARLSDIRKGDRAYVDTILNGNRMFAKSIRISSKQTGGDARGQVISYDAERKLLTIQEQISPDPVKFSLSADTVVTSNQRPSTLAELRPGSLVDITFVPGSQKLGEVRRINVLAAPGATFTFAGKVTFLDLRSKKIAIANRSDNETYEISLEPVAGNTLRGLREGVEATVTAAFDGKGYQAKSIEVASSPAQPE
jgi:hypothetical protein